MDTTIVAAIIGVVGTIIGAVIPWLLGRKSAARNETYDKVTGSFNEPQANEAIGRTIRCSGVVTGLQPGLNLWLAVEVGDLVWPKESKVLPDEANKWYVTIFEDGVTEQFAVSLFVADMRADRRIKDWLEAGRRAGRYSELRGIPGARRLARVDGLRVRASNGMSGRGWQRWA